MLTLQYPQSNFHLSFLANIISGINGTFENLRLSQNKIQYKLIHSLSIYTYMYICIHYKDKDQHFFKSKRLHIYSKSQNEDELLCYM